MIEARRSKEKQKQQEEKEKKKEQASKKQEENEARRKRRSRSNKQEEQEKEKEKHKEEGGGSTIAECKKRSVLRSYRRSSSASEEKELLVFFGFSKSRSSFANTHSHHLLHLLLHLYACFFGIAHRRERRRLANAQQKPNAKISSSSSFLSYTASQSAKKLCFGSCFFDDARSAITTAPSGK